MTRQDLNAIWQKTETTRAKLAQLNQAFQNRAKDFGETFRANVVVRKLIQHRRKFYWGVPTLVIIAVGTYAGYLYFITVPKLTGANFTTALPLSTKIEDRNGVALYQVNDAVRRQVIPSSDIPDLVKQATIAAEDRNFYHHFGVDPEGIARALVTDIKTGQPSQGGSTITQQLVKLTLLDNSKKTLGRKAQEAIAAMVLESRMNKDQILTAYLNSVPYGSNIMGIQEASETMFGKAPKDLTLDEIVTLAALPQSPSNLSPYTGNKIALQARREYILNELEKQKIITHDQALAAASGPVKVNPITDPIKAPHFSMMIRDMLIQEFGQDMVEKGGLVVKTTLDWNLQAKAEQIVQSNQGRLKGLGADNAAAVITDPQSGQVWAMVGNMNYYDSSIEGQVNVAISPRQPGSSFKPYVYATLLQKPGYSPASILWDVPTCFGTNYCPKNYSGRNYGPLTVREALDGSINVAAVKAGAVSGIDNVINTAENLGISTLNNRDQYGLSLALGAGEVKLVEHTNAMSAFGQNGQVYPLQYILSVTDASGEVLYQAPEAKPRQAVPAGVAYQLSDILSDNSSRAYIFGANSPLNFPRDLVAAKTGTTNNFKDTWTVGFSSSCAAGVWVGNTDGRVLHFGADGVFTAAPIWRPLIQACMDAHPSVAFQRPADLQLATVNTLKGTRTEYLASWQMGSDTTVAQDSNPAWRSDITAWLVANQPPQQNPTQPSSSNTASNNTPPPGTGDVGGLPSNDNGQSQPAPSTPNPNPSPPSNTVITPVINSTP